MFAQGISPGAAVWGMAAAASLLALLFFLKERQPLLMIPSLMLFQEESRKIRRSVLMKRFSNLFHYLLLLLAFAAAATALNKPVLTYNQTAPTVIVTTPQEWKEAVKLQRTGNPLTTRLLIADAGPQAIATFDATRTSGLINGTAALALADHMLATHSTGEIIWYSSAPPPYLPKHAKWVTPTETQKIPEAKPIPPLQLAGKSSSSQFSHILNVTTQKAGADTLLNDENTLANASQISALLYPLRSLRGAYTDINQKLVAKPFMISEYKIDNGSLRLEGVCWGLMFLLLLIDSWLYLRGKVV